MSTHQIDAMIEVNAKIALAGKEVIEILQGGDAADVIVQKRVDTKPRSVPQNRLIYLAYERIAKTLYGNDEIHARRECKLTIGCRILLRDSEGFKASYDRVIRAFDYETKLSAMDLISVSSLMSIKQGKEYIDRIINSYTLKGVYFADLDGANEYLKYPEVNRGMR